MYCAFQSVPVLLGEGDEAAVGAAARGTPRVGEQHEGEQSRHFAVVWEKAMDFPGQPDRLRSQLAALQVGT
jgi:hypothetical protein